PEYRIAVRALVDREVALEHRAPGAECRDTGFDVRPPRLGQRLRRRRLGLRMEIGAADPHTEPAELEVDVVARRERLDGSGPCGKALVALAGIPTDAERPTHMVEHNLCLRACAGQCGQFVDLRMVEPGIEREAEPPERLEALAE